MTQNNPFVNNMQGMGGQIPTPGVSNAVSNDNYEVDLTNVESGASIPDGSYQVTCIDIEQSVSKSGNPMFIWTFEVSEGQYRGFQLKVFTAITPAAMWKVAEIVQALGVGQIGSVVKFKRTDVLNKSCGALVQKSEYNGQERSQIVKIMSLKALAEDRI